MAFEADMLVDRRRLKRRLNFWRVAAVLALVFAGLTAAGAAGFGGASRSGLAVQRVVRVNVDGAITENRKLLEAIATLQRDRTVAAIVLSINSPGGTVSGGESLHAVFKRLASEKPVVAVMRGTAASAGYMIAMPAARVFAREATLTGSIGVILQTGNVGELLGRLGISADALTSGPLKDQPSFTKPLSPEGREYLNALVADMQDQFVGIVAAGRKMEPDAVRKLADGRAYTGRQALALGLVDEIGGEAEARAWLARERQVPERLPITDLTVGTFLQRLGGDVASGIWDHAIGSMAPAGGAWAIWQGGLGR